MIAEIDSYPREGACQRIWGGGSLGSRKSMRLLDAMLPWTEPASRQRTIERDAIAAVQLRSAFRIREKQQKVEATVNSRERRRVKDECPERR